MDTDFATLFVFRHLAATGNFTETGKAWNMSQPAVSLMISKLETVVGLVLFERQLSGARLTEAGRAYLVRAEEVCASYLTLVDGIHSLARRIDNEVMIWFDRTWISTRLKDEVSKCPGKPVAPRIGELTGNWAEALERERCDVVVAGRFLGAGLSGGVQEAVIRRERGITVAWNPDFYPFVSSRFNFPEILGAGVLLPDDFSGTGFADFLLRWCDMAYGRRPANVITFHSDLEAAEACMAGVGVMLSPGDLMPRLGPEFANLASVRTFEFLLPEAFTVGVYCRSDEDSKEVLAVAVSIVKQGRKFFS